MVDRFSKEQLKDLINELVEGDANDKTLTVGKVLRQLGGKLVTPFGDRKKEIEQLAEEAINKKRHGVGHQGTSKRGKKRSSHEEEDPDSDDQEATPRTRNSSKNNEEEKSEKASSSELRETVNEIVEGDEADETLTPGKVLRQYGGKTKTPLGDRKSEIQTLAEEAVNKKLHGNGGDKDDDESNDSDDDAGDDDDWKRKKEANSIAKRERESQVREVKATHEELREIVEDIVEGDEPDETLTSGKVLRQVGGKLRVPLGNRKREIQDLAEEAVEKKLHGQHSGGEDEPSNGAEKMPRRERRTSGGGGTIESDPEVHRRQLAIHRPVKLSPELADIIGKDTASRQEIGKKMRTIFKKRNLYDPEDERYINCDEELMKIFGEKRIDTSSMMKHLDHQFRDV